MAAVGLGIGCGDSIEFRANPLTLEPTNQRRELELMDLGTESDLRAEGHQGRFEVLIVGACEDGIGQATKGSRWIPWHTEAMKDVVTCDKSRGAGNTH